MARKDDGRLTPEQCDEIHDKVWKSPIPTLRELAQQAELHRVNVQGHCDQIREKAQHPLKRLRRTGYDLERAEFWLRFATIVAERLARFARQEEATQDAEFKKLGIDPANPNPDGSDFHLMSAIEAKSEEPPSEPEVRPPVPAEEEAFLDL